MSDVVVVGAGPAGASLALRLARAGYEVVLLERSHFPRMKVCGDYLSTGAVNGLNELGIAEPVLAGAHPIHSISLHGFGEHLRLCLPGDGAASLPRATLDARLLEQACSAGARLCSGGFLGVQEDVASLRIAYRDETGIKQELVSRVLVGADGAGSAVARRAGMAEPVSRRGPWALGGELRDQRGGDELSMYVGPSGYYARNPLSAHTVNSMLVVPTPAPRREADTLVARMTEGHLRFEAEKIDRCVAAGPLRYRATRVIQGRILLTGDAAELLNPFTGQGVATALALSVPAERAVTELLRGVPDARVARTYTAQWRSIVGPRRTLTHLIDAMVRVGFLRARVLRSVGRNPQAAQTMLASASGHLPARAALAPGALLRLLAS